MSPAHTPVAHSEPPAQGPPSGATLHVPPPQFALQQSAFVEQLAPMALQQRPPVHVPVQHSEVSVHAAPPARQQDPAAVQRAVQHCGLAVHAVPPARHVQLAPVHSVEQQSLPVAHDPPVGAQQRPPVHVPPQH
jgi:hypothetical protein